jgi:hypothetical protein
LWEKFKKSTAVVGIAARTGVEEALLLWLRDYADDIAAAHRRAADEIDLVPMRKKGGWSVYSRGEVKHYSV